MYNYASGVAHGGKYSVGHYGSLDPSSLKKTKDDILRSLSVISKSGGNVEEGINMLLSLPYELDVRDYTKAIQSCNTIPLLSLLMTEIHSRGLIPDLLLFNVYLKKCEDLKDKEEAFRVYHLLLDDQIKPDKHTIIVLVRCCLQANSPLDAERVLDDAFSRHVEVNSYMFNLLIDYFARRNQSSEAFRLRSKMMQYQIQPDEYTVSSLMAACCPELPSRANLSLLYTDVKMSPLPARSVCASALFSGIAKAVCLDNTQKLRIIVSFFDALRARGYVLGQHAYTSLMTCCAKVGALEQAKSFFEDMKECNIEANEYILTAFISTCGKAKDYVTALEVFNYMRWSPGKKCLPNKYTYEAMIVAAGNVGCLQDALQIYEDMLEAGFVADASTYSRLILVCGLCKDYYQGIQFIREFQSRRLPRTSFFYHSLIDFYVRNDHIVDAYATLKEVQASGTVEATQHHFEPIIRWLVESRRWNQVEELLEEWSNVSYTTLQYLILNGAKQGQWDQVLRCEQMMRSRGLRPYSALLPLIEEARKNQGKSTPIPHSLQFLEGRVDSVPEFIPAHMRSSGPMSKWSEPESLLPENWWICDDDRNLTLEELENVLETDFDFFTDYDD